MGDYLESGGLGFPHPGQVAKIPALHIFSLRGIGWDVVAVVSPLRNSDECRHVTALPQQFALGIHHANIHAVKIFELCRLPL